MTRDFKGPWIMAAHFFMTAPFWLAFSGIVVAWVCSIGFPMCATFFRTRFSWVYYALEKKYGFYYFYQIILVRGTQALGQFLLVAFDMKLIDRFFVNGSGRMIVWVSKMMRQLQTGYLYHYAFAMVIGLFVLLGWRLL